MLLELDTGMMIWAWITFLCLLIILYKTAWKPILATIDKREKTIKDSLESAQSDREEAQSLLEKHQAMMQTAENEAHKIIADYKAKAEKMHKELTAQAKQEAEKIVKKAQSELEGEKEAAMVALRRDIADMVVNATKKFIGDTLDDERQKRLIDEYIAEIPVKDERSLN
jgi:F-type H+-transporting ATPase subunit b